MKEIILSNNDVVKGGDSSLAKSEPHQITDEILDELNEIWVDSKMMAGKIKDWLRAKTLNAKWDVMEDHRAQQKAFEYIMKMKWVKMDWGMNINIFNFPSPDDKLKF